MITSTNSYILSYKGHTPKIEERVDSEGKNSFNIYLQTGPRTIFNKIFNLEDSDWKEVDKFFSYTVEFDYSLEEIHSTVNFELFKVAKDYYLNIGATASTRHKSVTVLENIDNKLFKPKARLTEEYWIFPSYDAISEYYCNKIYPKLAYFERSLRRLLFNLYILNYGESYQRKAIAPAITLSAERKIRNKKNKDEISLTQFFYLFEFSDYRRLLFTKEWLPIDQDEKDKFLRDNKKLRDLPEEKLLKFVENLGPKTGWERFFSERNILDIEQYLEEIQERRNIVAHSKIFTKDAYLKTVSSLKILTETVISAIENTQQRDFPEKNSKALKATLEKINESFKEFFSYDYKFSPGSLASIGDSIEQSFKSILFQNNVVFPNFYSAKADQEESIDETDDSKSINSSMHKETEVETSENKNELSN